MARVFIPPMWRDLTGGTTEAAVDGDSLGDVVAALEARFPGIAARICEHEDLRSSLAVSIDGVVIVRGLLAAVGPESEVHFLPAIGGG